MPPGVIGYGDFVLKFCHICCLIWLRLFGGVCVFVGTSMCMNYQAVVFHFTREQISLKHSETVRITRACFPSTPTGRDKHHTKAPIVNLSTSKFFIDHWSPKQQPVHGWSSCHQQAIAPYLEAMKAFCTINGPTVQERHSAMCCAVRCRQLPPKLRRSTR